MGNETHLSQDKDLSLLQTLFAVFDVYPGCGDLYKAERNERDREADRALAIVPRVASFAEPHD